MKLNATRANQLAEEPVLAYRGRLEEFMETIASHQRALYHIALRRLDNSADAEDAVQDALLSAYTHLHQFKREAQMSTWLTTIVINSARLRARRRPRGVHLSLEGGDCTRDNHSLQERLPDRRPTPEERCINTELDNRIAYLSKNLAPSLYKAFVLRDVNGLTTRETADALGLREGAVKARLVRARDKLIRLARKELRKKHSNPASPIRTRYRPL